MVELKPALAYEEQVVRLRNEHSLIVEDEQEAVDILSRVNYYRLSAYGIGLKRSDDPERYVDGISLKHLFRLYEFDSHLRNALVHLVEQVEIQLRTQIAYHLSLKYGPEGYRDVQNFQDRVRQNGESVHVATMNMLDREIQNQQDLPFVRHHNQKYEGHFPLWVAVELFSFGMLVNLYTIMKSEDRRSVAQNYPGVDQHHLKSWMFALLQVRNQCAHYGRIYNMPFSHQPYLFSEYHCYRGSKIFPILIVLRKMVNDPLKWTTFIETLRALFEEYPEVNLSFMGFPQDWERVLTAPSNY